MVDDADWKSCFILVCILIMFNTKIYIICASVNFAPHLTINHPSGGGDGFEFASKQLCNHKTVEWL